MFIGHFAVAFAAKRVEPRLQLGLAFLAVQFLDLIWPVLVLLGIERVSVEPGATAVTPLNFESYPWSHSLLMTLVWSALLGGLTYWRTRTPKWALLVAALVTSHWLLDWLTHRPDLPLFPGGELQLGLGLWNSRIGTLGLEGLLFAVGLGLYVTVRPAPGQRRRKWALAGLVAFLLVIYAGNLFGPPPAVGTPGAALAAPALAMWLLVLWGWYADKPVS